MKQSCVVVAARGNQLSQAFASALGADFIEACVSRFPDGELHVQVPNIQHASVCVWQSLAAPVNDQLVQLLLLLNALRRSKSCRVLAVVPYFGYARQQSTPCYSELQLFSCLLCTAGAAHIVSLDIHGMRGQSETVLPQLQQVQALPLFINDMRQQLDAQRIDRSAVVVVSPDAGGAHVAAACAQKLGVGVAIVDKKRLTAAAVRCSLKQGDLTNCRVAIVIDDLIDSGQTLIQTAHLLRQHNVSAVWAYATHALLTQPQPFFKQCHLLDSLVVTDTVVPSPQLLQCRCARVLSCVPLLAQAAGCWFGRPMV